MRTQQVKRKKKGKGRDRKEREREIFDISLLAHNSITITNLNIYTNIYKQYFINNIS